MISEKVASAKFSGFHNDDATVPPAERATIDFEVALIGKLIEAREAKGLTQAQLAEVALAHASGDRSAGNYESHAADRYPLQSIDAYGLQTRHCAE
ncbi:MAG: hypothetical protein LBO66_02925 [Deltaproteobacteria bacterium]|jgi:hypothetical protein|nr:hypothetical protein [Deltaproteobacteria bacterium]